MASRSFGRDASRSRRTRTERETRAAAEKIGYPLIVKPIAGAGSADTYKAEDKGEIDVILAKMRNVEEASCEEYVAGERKVRPWRVGQSLPNEW